MGFDVVVIGSINEDLTVQVARHPRPGETILGTGHTTGPGGKGANQAVAAARLGRSVALVARVGADMAGTEMLNRLRGEGVNIDHVGVDPQTPTGLAVITLDEGAENAITVSPGANTTLTSAAIDDAGSAISTAAVLLCQLEVPVETIEHAMSLATGITVLNPAPARVTRLEPDVLVPNRSELGALAGIPVPESRREISKAVRDLGLQTVVVTLGSEGALVVDGGVETLVEAPRVTPVDTTGAGDAFCGALADALSREESLLAAVRWAVAAGACAVTRAGAQSGMPTPEQVQSLL